MTTLQTYTPLSAVQDWYQYFKHLNKTGALDCINDDFTPVGSKLPNSKIVCEMMKLATDSASGVLSALAALELTMPDLSSRTHLTFHVLGGTARELMLLRMNEELLHLLPKLETIIVGYIGPEVPGDMAPGSLESSQCCPQCTTAGRKRQIFLRRHLYHECDKADMFPDFPPDLIMAYNSGHSDEAIDTWRPTLNRILDMGIPALFTTYNEQEAAREQANLRSMDANILHGYEENRWRGLVPKLENFGARYEVFYNNYFRYIIQGRTG